MPSKQPEYLMDLIQGTEEWHRARLGILTASEMKLALTPTLKIANNDKTRAHVYELAAQRYTDYIEPHYESWDMLRGKQEEIYAKDLYSEHYAQIKDCGFIRNDSLGFMIGYSPDGLVGDDGLVEVKSRASKYQIETVTANEMPKEFMLQVQTGLFVSGREWCDFISYSNGMPMFVSRIEPIPEYQEAIKEAATQFEQKVVDTLNTFKKNAEHLIVAPRIELDTGDEITPSAEAA